MRRWFKETVTRIELLYTDYGIRIEISLTQI